jgi:hypothetical protein
MSNLRIVKSMECYNREIEWNFAYFKKIRLCFSCNQKKLKDVKFQFRDTAVSSAMDDVDDIEKLLARDSPKVIVYMLIF